ncbi:MAG: sialidase family protein [Ginsengibacter sp.]
MKKNILILLTIYMFSACSEKKVYNRSDFIIAEGQMPNLVKDKDDNLHLVYGYGDSIMYSYSADHGQSFSRPYLISVVPNLAASHSRGPQIAATNKELIVIACNSSGDIFSYSKAGSGSWAQTGKVNDEDTVAKENLIALSGDEENAFAVWLDVRGNKHNKIYGAKSGDGGKTWSKNMMIYTSPDTTVCECCKPSVAVAGSKVYVMFRNWLQGNRDLYMIQSSDGGNSFKQAQKLGNGNWKLNGCPMDGGGLAINKNGEIQTVWRRQGKIYAATTGSVESEIGEGRSCTLETVNGKNVYAWTENGDVVIIEPQGSRKILGKGSQPVLKALNNEHVICLWENDNHIHASIVEL